MHHIRIACVGLLLLLAALVPIGTPAAGATTLPSGFQATIIANNQIFAPTLMSFTPEGHIVIAQQNGKVKVWSGAAVSTTPYLQPDRRELVRPRRPRNRLRPGLRDEPLCLRLLPPAVADDPRRDQPLRRPAGWSERGPGHRDRALRDGPPERSTVSTPAARSQFGPDGKLYVSIGDDARGIDVSHNLGVRPRQDPAPQQGRLDPGRQPLLHPGYGQVPLDLLQRSPQPLHLRLRPAGPPDAGRGRPHYLRGDQRRRGRPGLRLARLRRPRQRGRRAMPTPLPATAHDAERPPTVVAPSSVRPPWTRRPPRSPTSYDGDLFYADYCNGWMKSFDPVTGVEHPLRHRDRDPDRPRLQARRQPLLPDSEHRFRLRVDHQDHLHRQHRTHRSRTQPHDMSVGVGQPATFTVDAQGAALSELPVVPRRHPHQRSHRRELHAHQRPGCPTTGRTFTVKVSNSEGDADQPACHAHGRQQPGPERDHHLPGGHADLRRRAEDLLLRHCDRPRGRHAAGISIRLGDRLSPRHAHPPVSRPGSGLPFRIVHRARQQLRVLRQRVVRDPAPGDRLAGQDDDREPARAPAHHHALPRDQPEQSLNWPSTGRG